MWDVAGKSAEPIILSDRERAVLDRIARPGGGRQAMALRAGIVLLAAEGLSNRSISDRLLLEEHCVGRWRRRFAREGIWGLFDRPRSGAPRKNHGEGRYRR
ncbi:helix-turn-helix domain-containing protein [Inquilinus sp. NPDC058860]|uniref:helix-turn-helix domain-containing protein n=1 Tax=Inquilinus sp. NPDC058860 TaxID=3346652 RepID=UPI0036AFCBAA